MKKLVLVLLLGTILAGGVFAQHPGGWALGVGAQFGGTWQSSVTGQSLSVFLKAPQLPIYWGIDLALFQTNSFSLGVTGDYFLIDEIFVPEARLGWFLGLGGYFQFSTGTGGSSWTMIDFGVRLPIGIYIFPVDFLEIFLDIAPSLGFYTYVSGGSAVGLGGGWQGDFGIRFWF